MASTWKVKGSMKLTKIVVDKLQPPIDKAQQFYRDDQLKGFALRITANGVKSFIVEKLIDRKVRRMTLGRYGELTVEQARKEAQKLLGKIATGINPIQEQREAKVRTITLATVFNDYLKARKNLKPNTTYGYHRLMARALANWRNKPLLSITKDKISKLHVQLAEESGEAYANSAMRLLRAIFNFAAGQYEDAKGLSLIPENPVKRLSQTRAWYQVKRRQTFIKSHELAAWYQGVMKLENKILQDYLLLLLFTGLRRQEAAKLRWKDIDLKSKTLVIENTKNQQAHMLPLSDFLYELLLARYRQATNEYVFPGTGSNGYIIEPRKQMAKVTKESGVAFTIHDLRRTFITIAESLDISAYAVKRLVNHKMNNDVTAGYIMNDVERLRKPMQAITDYLLGQIKINDKRICHLKLIK
jgi:integrase